ncbi:Transposase and inactivated derivatives, IS5 family [Ectothiorhodospira magna]|uniref:Transposase and inactivated derivatives, IS5 family n=1 Tax=Ectothiorhodospira magna TaxID=867345 RepID=A0A1H9DGY8_9GAMM|nr:IS5 family transposase [Ectothiorhodospira magna]SEQ12587.1 Transposase and inactivated derivatives, IS5 family [Ectothiorhodospira magna]
MKRPGLSDRGLAKRPKATRKEVFLAEMDAATPWERLCACIEPYYPKAGKGRRPYPLETMLRISFMQHWFNYADEAMEDALYDMPVLARFAGLDIAVDTIPDATTILRFRHLLERHGLCERLFAEVATHLAEKGLLLRRGTIVDATLIQAPPSTKNRERKRDPQMSQTKKGNQWHFGMKVHIGVDSNSGLVHTVVGTTAKVPDNKVLDELLHGDEKEILGDKAYTSNERNLSSSDPERGPIWAFPYKKPKGGELPQWKRDINRRLSALRAIVEHPFRVVKRQFGYVKVRYRGLAKNVAHQMRLFMLANLYLVRRSLCTS